MTITPRFRKIFFTAHITFSIGWFGAVAAFVVLNVWALKSGDIQVIRSAYIAMDLLGWYVILPFCFGSLIIGLTQALFTPWGLFKHYWIATKFFLTVGCTILLLVHLQAISRGAMLASTTLFSITELQDIGIMLRTKSILALLVLLTITTISVYKPWGKIQWRRRNDNEHTVTKEKYATKKRWVLYIILGLIILLVLFMAKHLSNGMNH